MRTKEIAKIFEIEDLLALSSSEYLESIKEARNNFREGKVKTFEEVFDV